MGIIRSENSFLTRASCSHANEGANYTLRIIFVRRDDTSDVDSAESIYKGKHIFNSDSPSGIVRGHICSRNIRTRSLERKNERGQWHKEHRLTAHMIYYRFLEAILLVEHIVDAWTYLSIIFLSRTSCRETKNWTDDKEESFLHILKSYKLYPDIIKNILYFVEI